MTDGKMIADRYMVVTSLGEGGMADVYLAIDTILNREVAVKVLRGELSKDPVTLLRFQREASAVSKLHHPNVVEVYDVGEFDDQNYIVMEYVRGRTLKQLINQRGALDKTEAVDIMKQLVSAVAHAHEKNIIHRDIKPQNVLVKDDGTVKITDFGIAVAYDSVQLTQSDSVLGSAHYIAPETTRGESATVQVDIYALGIVFYELLTGKVPFTGDNPVQIAMKHMREEMPSVRAINNTIPQSVENIIIKATAKNKLQRYATAKDMLFDLDICLLPEFANVEKINLDTPEETGQGETMVFDGARPTTPASNVDREQIKKEIEEENKAKRDAKKKKTRTILAIVAIVALLIAGGTLGVYYSGLIDGFGPTEYVRVPDLSGMTKSEAKAELSDKQLELNSDVKEEITVSTKKGLIISQTPAATKRVSVGSKVTITVSSGNYFIADDYTGMTLAEATKALKTDAKKDYDIDFTILKEYQTTTQYTPGTIISQSLVKKGAKIKPGISKQISFVIAAAPNFVMASYTNADVNTAKSTLESLGAAVQLSVLSTDGMTDTQKAALTKNVVINQDPAAGTLYTQEGNNVVTLYYYQ